MRTILLTLMFLMMGASSLSQVTTDTAYLRVAKDEIVAQMTGEHAEVYRSWGLSFADTANIICILPIYSIPKTYRDSVRRQSTFADLVKFEPNPLNQQIIIKNKKEVSMIYYERGFVQEDLKDYIGTPYYESYKSESSESWLYSSGFMYFLIGTITRYRPFEKLLKSHPAWSFFRIRSFGELWAFDENHQLLHIYPRRRKLVIESGQSFYENLVQRIGIETIKFKINPNLPKESAIVTSEDSKVK
ncbi:MAG: hypothetical protein ACI35Q_05740 [Marinilabiliaceae bacterium]